MADCANCPSKGTCQSTEGCEIKNNPNNKIKHVIGVMSGKGGVGKSTISVLLAKELKKRGHSVGILDADITGPSIPRLLGVRDAKVMQSEKGILPVEAEGIFIMSLNLLLGDERQPVIWRGPIIAGTVKQFWEEVYWGDLDYLIIDMPPGTGDVALTVMQSIPVSGMVMVSVPQDMVSMIVAKAVNMIRMMNINLIGVVENMSYLKCPHCDEKIQLFTGDRDALTADAKLLGELPMLPAIAAITDTGLAAPDEDTQQKVASITDAVIEALG